MKTKSWLGVGSGCIIKELAQSIARGIGSVSVYLSNVMGDAVEAGGTAK